MVDEDLTEENTDASLVKKLTRGRRSLRLFAVLVLVLIVYRYIDWRQVSEVVDIADPFLILVSFLPVVAAYLLRGYVWVRLLGVAEHGVTKTRIYVIFLTGAFAKRLLPPVADLAVVTYILERFWSLGYGDSAAQAVSIDYMNRIIPAVLFGGMVLPLLVVSEAETGSIRLASVLVLIILTSLVLAIVVFRSRPRVRDAVVAVAQLTARLAESMPRTGVKAIDCRLEGLADSLNENSVRRTLRDFFIMVDGIADDSRSLFITFLCGSLAWLLLASPLYILLVAIGETQPVVVVLLVAVLGYLSIPVVRGAGPTPVTALGLSQVGGTDISVAVSVAVFYQLQLHWIPLLSGGLAGTYLFGKDRPNSQ